LLHVHSPVLDPILHVSRPILECLRLCSEPLSKIGRFARVTAKRGVTIVSSVSQRQNRNRVAVVKPKQNGTLKLRNRNSLFRKNLYGSGRFRIGTKFCGAHGSIRGHKNNEGVHLPKKLGFTCIFVVTCY